MISGSEYQNSKPGRQKNFNIKNSRGYNFFSRNLKTKGKFFVFVTQYLYYSIYQGWDFSKLSSLLTLAFRLYFCWFGEIWSGKKRRVYRAINFNFYWVRNFNDDAYDHIILNGIELSKYCQNMRNPSKKILAINDNGCWHRIRTLFFLLKGMCWIFAMRTKKFTYLIMGRHVDAFFLRWVI